MKRNKDKDNMAGLIALTFMKASIVSAAGALFLLNSPALIYKTQTALENEPVFTETKQTTDVLADSLKKNNTVTAVESPKTEVDTDITADDTVSIDAASRIIDYVNEPDGWTAWNVFDNTNTPIQDIVTHNSLIVETKEERALHQMADEADTGELVTLQNQNQLVEFESYYCFRHAFSGQGTTYQYHTCSSGIIKADVPDETETIPDSMMNVLKSIRVPEPSEDDLETTKAIMQAVNDYFTYDKAYTCVPVTNALIAQRGVCYHHAHSAYVLLNAVGIPTKLDCGTLDGKSHDWCVSLINGEYYVVDPTTDEIYEGIPDNYVSSLL